MIYWYCRNQGGRRQGSGSAHPPGAVFRRGGIIRRPLRRCGGSGTCYGRRALASSPYLTGGRRGSPCDGERIWTPGLWCITMFGAMQRDEDAHRRGTPASTLHRPRAVGGASKVAGGVRGRKRPPRQRCVGVEGVVVGISSGGGSPARTYIRTSSKWTVYLSV
jgi:hypothetical protein